MQPLPETGQADSYSCALLRLDHRAVVVCGYGLRQGGWCSTIDMKWGRTPPSQPAEAGHKAVVCGLLESDQVDINTAYLHPHCPGSGLYSLVVA